MKIKKRVLSTVVLSLFVMTIFSFSLFVGVRHAFADGCGTVKVHVLQTGQVKVSDFIPFGVSSLPSHSVIVAVTAYLIETPKGKVLIDTGWHTVVRTSPLKHLGLSYVIATPILPEGQAVTEQLAAMGISPADLDYVTFTHLDTDHASGIKLIANAKKHTGQCR